MSQTLCVQGNITKIEPKPHEQIVQTVSKHPITNFKILAMVRKYETLLMNSTLSTIIGMIGRFHQYSTIDAQKWVCRRVLSNPICTGLLTITVGGGAGCAGKDEKFCGVGEVGVPLLSPPPAASGEAGVVICMVTFLSLLSRLLFNFIFFVSAIFSLSVLKLSNISINNKLDCSKFFAISCSDTLSTLFTLKIWGAGQDSCFTASDFISTEGVCTVVALLPFFDFGTGNCTRGKNT